MTNIIVGGTVRWTQSSKFADAMSTISCRTVAGTGGRPRGCDFNRQNNRYALRCQRMSVAGCTMVRIRRHSTSRDSATSVIRVASSARRGFTWRSAYKANCFLRNTFSAARWACDRTAAAANDARSPQRRTTVRAAARARDRLISRQSYRIGRLSTPREGSAHPGRDVPQIWPRRNSCGPHRGTRRAEGRSFRLTCDGVDQRGETKQENEDSTFHR